MAAILFHSLIIDDSDLSCLSLSTIARIFRRRQRETVRRYLVSHHGEQIAEFVGVESGKRSDRPELATAMALAKKRKATMLVAKLDRLSRSVALIATLVDSRGFDLAIADMPGAS